MTRSLMAAMVLLFGLLAAPLPARAAATRAIPPLLPIPTTLSAARQAELRAEKTRIDAAYATFDAAAKRFNAKAAKDQGDQEFDAVMSQREAYIDLANDFNAWVRAELERIRVIQAMTAHLAQLTTWAAKEKQRALAALEQLDADGDGKSGPVRIEVTWERIIARQPSAALLALAARDGGPGFPGAGTQSGQDCAVFALANASGTPYGAVAAMATGLLRDAAWRSAAARADPAGTITRVGLIGGEVVLLAEALGQATVVRSTDFESQLRAGHRILINTFPASGDLESGHEVVLTKTMELDGETWFALMDSNQPPNKFLYLTKAELMVILKETGVMFQSDEKSTPRLLR
jgi:hypothetical protein